MKLRKIISIVVFILCLLFVSSVQGSDRAFQFSGAGSFTFTDEKGDSNKPITVWYYQPPELSTLTPVVFVMHGMNRDGKRYRDEWMENAKQYGFILIVPEFSKNDYPGTNYNYGNMFEKNGMTVAEDKWLFSSIEHLFDHVKKTTNNQSSKYYIYGHSAGGQFVHRMIIFKPYARIRKAIAANAGAYALPTFSTKFPYGLGGTTIPHENLRLAFAQKLIILLGENDTNEYDPNLNKSRAAMLQGNNRVERGQNFYRIAKDEASTLNATFNWRLETISGAAHHNSQMANTAVHLFFQN